MYRTKLVYIFITAILILLSLSITIFDLSIIEIASYCLLFTGIYVFFNSYLKKHKTGLIGGSTIFLTGTITFIISKYEILNLGSVFIPIVLVVLGVSILLSNLLLKMESVWVAFSLLCVFAGIWMVVSRADINFALFTSAVYSIIKNYWLIVIGVFIIIFTALKFKKNN